MSFRIRRFLPDFPRRVPHRTRSLLRTVLLILGSAAAHAPDARAVNCPMPPQLTNTSTLQVGDLLFTLGTTSSSYVVYQGFEMRLQVENTGTSTVVIPNPLSISPLYSINIVPAGCDSINDPACWAGVVTWSPQVVLFFGTPITLAPGQCAVHSRVYGGIPDGGGPAVPGFYEVLAGYWQSFDSGPTNAPIRIWLPDGGIRLPIQIYGETPTLPATWSGVKTFHR